MLPATDLNLSIQVNMLKTVQLLRLLLLYPYPYYSQSTATFSLRMQRCVSLNKIAHRLGLIFDDVVDAAADRPGLDVCVSIYVKTICHLRN